MALSGFLGLFGFGAGAVAYDADATPSSGSDNTPPPSGTKAPRTPTTAHLEDGLVVGTCTGPSAVTSSVAAGLRPHNGNPATKTAEGGLRLVEVEPADNDADSPDATDGRQAEHRATVPVPDLGRSRDGSASLPDGGVDSVAATSGRQLLRQAGGARSAEVHEAAHEAAREVEGEAEAEDIGAVLGQLAALGGAAGSGAELLLGVFTPGLTGALQALLAEYAATGALSAASVATARRSGFAPGAISAALSAFSAWRRGHGRSAGAAASDLAEAEGERPHAPAGVLQLGEGREQGRVHSAGRDTARGAGGEAASSEPDATGAGLAAELQGLQAQALQELHEEGAAEAAGAVGAACMEVDEEEDGAAEAAVVAAWPLGGSSRSANALLGAGPQPDPGSGGDAACPDSGDSGDSDSDGCADGCDGSIAAPAAPPAPPALAPLLLPGGLEWAQAVRVRPSRALACGVPLTPSQREAAEGALARAAAAEARALRRLRARAGLPAPAGAGAGAGAGAIDGGGARDGNEGLVEEAAGEARQGTEEEAEAEEATVPVLAIPRPLLEEAATWLVRKHSACLAAFLAGEGAGAADGEAVAAAAAAGSAFQPAERCAAAGALLALVHGARSAAEVSLLAAGMAAEARVGRAAAAAAAEAATDHSTASAEQAAAPPLSAAALACASYNELLQLTLLAPPPPQQQQQPLLGSHLQHGAGSGSAGGVVGVAVAQARAPLAALDAAVFGGHLHEVVRRYRRLAAAQLLLPAAGELGWEDLPADGAVSFGVPATFLACKLEGSLAVEVQPLPELQQQPRKRQRRSLTDAGSSAAEQGRADGHPGGAGDAAEAEGTPEAGDAAEAGEAEDEAEGEGAGPASLEVHLDVGNEGSHNTAVEVRVARTDPSCGNAGSSNDGAGTERSAGCGGMLWRYHFGGTAHGLLPTAAAVSRLSDADVLAAQALLLPLEEAGGVGAVDTGDNLRANASSSDKPDVAAAHGSGGPAPGSDTTAEGGAGDASDSCLQLQAAATPRGGRAGRREAKSRDAAPRSTAGAGEKGVPAARSGSSAVAAAATAPASAPAVRALPNGGTASGAPPAPVSVGFKRPRSQLEATRGAMAAAGATAARMLLSQARAGSLPASHAATPIGGAGAAGSGKQARPPIAAAARPQGLGSRPAFDSAGGAAQRKAPRGDYPEAAAAQSLTTAGASESKLPSRAATPGCFWGAQAADKPVGTTSVAGSAATAASKAVPLLRAGQAAAGAALTAPLPVARLCTCGSTGPSVRHSFRDVTSAGATPLPTSTGGIGAAGARSTSGVGDTAASGRFLLSISRVPANSHSGSVAAVRKTAPKKTFSRIATAASAASLGEPRRLISRELSTEEMMVLLPALLGRQRA